MTAAVKRQREDNAENSFKTEWSCDSNLAVELYFIPPTDKTSEDTFYHPTFTYWASNQDEKWFGYKGLKLKIYFSSSSFRVCYKLTYDEKIQENNPYHIAPDNILPPILNYLPTDVYDNIDNFKNGLNDDELKFKPFGDLITEKTDISPKIIDQIKLINTGLNIENCSLEIYKCNYFTPGFREYYHRFKILAPLFIEGATGLEDDNPRWEFICLYSKISIEDPLLPGSTLTIYQLLGFCNVYNFYHHPDKLRIRISQFIILPPYHKLGLGSYLYSTIYDHYTKMDNVIDFGVEEPNNDFSDVRDLSDLKTIINSPTYETLTLPYDEELIQTIYKTFKFSKKQVHRALELAHMYKVFSIKDKIEYMKSYNEFKLQVKRRLYKVNSVGLSHLSAFEMKYQLDELFTKFVDDYIRLVKKLKLEN
ncbi:acyl-CoA N-acyltransferase [Conidiobolus coronatus NRRL 28638]|uniref:Histone acetyltransferase type B catalytic subunit n=1 Tax=Conidiobolus coronatus (strain ATCC 28846 / CBS 209.66 / NRRL 28638) TaxID=796925 RepID=A0A137NXF8_CONC2|nr:acyl-CoA N-acyltransferase [Conidiobolus coronatus NRRL 28638]|eukprot:KXN67456.1 acyl-CoA N-acyltransferase [Conidiobolus coronatus NRRL 28638]